MKLVVLGDNAAEKVNAISEIDFATFVEATIELLLRPEIFLGC